MKKKLSLEKENISLQSQTTTYFSEKGPEIKQLRHEMIAVKDKMKFDRDFFEKKLKKKKKFMYLGAKECKQGGGITDFRKRLAKAKGQGAFVRMKILSFFLMV